MALKNTTFRLAEEDITALADLVEETGMKSGELKRQVVRLGIEAIKGDLKREVDVDSLSPAFSGILMQQKKMSDMVERQLFQAEKAIERQKQQAETIVAKMATQQRRLSDMVERQVSQAEKALSSQRVQVDKLLDTIVSQPRKLSDQVREHLPKLPDFDWRRKGEVGEPLEEGENMSEAECIEVG